VTAKSGDARRPVFQRKQQDLSLNLTSDSKRASSLISSNDAVFKLAAWQDCVEKERQVVCGNRRLRAAAVAAARSTSSDVYGEASPTAPKTRSAGGLTTDAN